MQINYRNKSKLKQLATRGLAETFNESFFTTEVKIEGKGVFIPSIQAAWQETQRGKTLESEAGFAGDTGGTLKLRRDDVENMGIGKLSGCIAERVEDGLKMRLRGIEETAIMLTFDLQPLST